jgi:hypothetical protein
LREYIEHSLARCSGGVEWIQPRITHPTAEQQPGVRRAPEIIEHEIHIGDRDVFPHEPLHAYFT